MGMEITVGEAPGAAERRSGRRLARFLGAARRVGGFAVSLALPPLCAACRAPVASEGLCAACWSRLTFIAPPFCECLGIPFPFDPGAGTLSMEAIADPPPYGRARAAVCFDETARVLVHALKYGDRLDLAPLMGRFMANAGRELTASADLLVPVPLHWRRQWTRRFNQSALLADAIGKASGCKVSYRALRRVKSTAHQVGLARSERSANVQGAFAVPRRRQKDLAGLRLVLVDDVLTSGATIEACTRALLRAGAAQVDVLVFARVVAPARLPI
jgi:ComF family protein